MLHFFSLVISIEWMWAYKIAMIRRRYNPLPFKFKLIGSLKQCTIFRNMNPRKDRARKKCIISTDIITTINPFSAKKNKEIFWLLENDVFCLFAGQFVWCILFICVNRTILYGPTNIKWTRKYINIVTEMNGRFYGIAHTASPIYKYRRRNRYRISFMQTIRDNGV